MDNKQKPVDSNKEEKNESKAKGVLPLSTDSCPLPTETGGPKGPDPTRYGDWEIGGKCIDF